MPLLTTEQAIVQLRADPDIRDQIIRAYLDEDVRAAAARFILSEEWRETCRWIEFAGANIDGAAIIDLGAGTGIVSFAFAQAGAALIYALEPDPSEVVGQGAIKHLTDNLPIEIISSYGEALPFRNQSIDIVYARQVLHHTFDLDLVLREAARVLKPGGVFIACREHVVDDEDQLAAFLASHPVHKLAGGENAYHLEQYRNAITKSGLKLLKLLSPFDSVITAYPALTQAQVDTLVQEKLSLHFGAIGRFLARVDIIDLVVRGAITRRNANPGRLYAFLARKSH